jgi:cytochrome c peroxidase
MNKNVFRSSVSVAAIAAISLFVGGVSPSNGAVPSKTPLWQIGGSDSALTHIAINGNLANLKKGQTIYLPLREGSLQAIRLTQVTPEHLGGISLKGKSADGNATLDMVIAAGQVFGKWSTNNAPALIFHSDAANGPAIMDAQSLDLLPARLEAETLLRQMSNLPDGPMVAWVSSRFEDKYGLASAARLQYLVNRINAVRTNNGQGSVELVATRRVDQVDNDPGFKATGLTFTPAKPLASDENLALAAAVLPTSRSVKTGVAATAFATIINPGASTATACGLVMNGSAPAGAFHFQETDAANAPTGVQDQTVSIAGNAAQSFVFSFSANTAQNPGLELPIEFSCANRQSAVIVSGLNTLFFSASDTDVPDIIAVSETGSAVGLNTAAGVVDMVDRAKDGAFVVATSNVGIAGSITVFATSSASDAFPVNIRVCQTNPVDGTCFNAPTAEVTLTIGAGETPSFAFFTNSDTVWPFDPANNRLNVVFKEGSAIRGSTSVALRTLQGTPELPTSLVDYEAIANNLPAHFTTSTGGSGGMGGMNNRIPLNEDNTPADNPVTNAGATLGRVLFYDKRLSVNDTVSCSSCHEQDKGFSDPDVLSTGFAGGKTGRHSMGLANARFYGPGAFFWDERAAALEIQVVTPIQDSVEMGMTMSDLLPKLQAVSFYPDLFNAAFGDPTVTEDRISKALAQFVRSLVSTNSKFDQAYINGTPEQPDFAGTFTSEEILGKNLFAPSPGSGVMSLGCASCHGTTAQILDSVQNNGLDANTDADQGAGNGAFKAPSLRNIAVRAPYMHDGRFSTLEEVIEFYNSGIQDHPNLSPRLRQGGPNGEPRRMNLTAAEKAALLAFLNTLTDDTFLNDTRFSDPFNKR